MKEKSIALLMVFCGWSVAAALPGDVNGDGAVNAADLVRARKIAAGELPFDSAADVDGDSAVTKVDVWLIQEAVLGRPMPERVDSAVIGSAEGTLSHGNITVTIPPGSSGKTHLALMRCVDDSLDNETPLHNVYMVCGLTTNLAGLVVGFANCGADTGLCAGAYLQPRDAGEMRWGWQALPDSSFVRNGTQISRAFAAPGADDLAISHSVKFALLTADAAPVAQIAAPLALAAPPVTAPTIAALEGAAPASVPGHRYAGYLHTGWISDKFEVYTKDWGTVTYDNLETVCDILYDIYGKIQAMGFQLDAEHASIFPLEVFVCQNSPDDGGFVYNPLTGARWIELKAGLLAHPGEMKATLGHELMHYVLGQYQGGNSFAFESLEDAITTWFEAVAADNPAHQSGNHTARRAAPLKGLFQPITRGWLGGRDWSAQERHGYGTSAFIDYCFDDHRAWIYELAQKVRGGQTVRDALDNLFVEKQGDLDGLDRTYLKFARDYLMTAPNCYSAAVNPDAIFATDSETDLSKMYKLVSIKKPAPELLEKQEVELKVRDYGCGVIQFKIFKPDRVFSPHTRLRATAPEMCSGVDLLMQARNSAGVIQSEIVTGVFGLNDKGENEWSCELSLPPDAEYILLSVLATMANQGQISDYAEEHDIVITYQFEGDYYMPMQESFHQFTELNTRAAHYEQQINCDAVLRVVDSTSTAGLDRFSVGRHVTKHPSPQENYTLNLGISSMTATRRTTDALQLQIFSNVSVPELPPFSINLDGDNGYYPVTIEGQMPVIAGDGTPKMELMVYYTSQSSQVFPGEAAFRIQHITTSVGELLQSADGLSGGITVDIPAQIDENRCLIYLFAADQDAFSPLRTAFLISIYPKATEGQ